MNLPISSASNFAATLQGLLGLVLKADIAFNGVNFAYRLNPQARADVRYELAEEAIAKMSRMMQSILAMLSTGKQSD